MGARGQTVPAPATAPPPPPATAPPAASPTATGAGVTAPLTDEAFVAAVQAPGDERPHSVKRHYMWSNERRHDLFFGQLAGLGGGYVGVGADQNYTLAAAATAKVLWLLDLDPAVVRVHKLYSALISEAETPDALVALFERPALPAVKAAIERRAKADSSSLVELYLTYRGDLHDHLRKQRERAHTWLGDAAKYATIRGLAQRGRIVARLGDLNGPRTMQQIAQAARAAAVPVRIIYLSNAESWFSYRREFRDNLRALPLDERSLVLRTVKSEVLRYPTGDIWHYNAQHAQHFTTRVAGPGYHMIDYVMLDAVEGTERGVSRMGFPDIVVPELKTAADARRERERRNDLLQRGVVTRPDGNRETAEELDKDRKERAARDLAKR